jgi:outer membrane protein insertion porin family
VNYRVAAALARIGAFCGLLVVPSVAFAQLKCENTDTEKQIRSVSFTGNTTFTDDELATHIITTPTDRWRKLFRKVIGTERCIRPGLLTADALRLRTFYIDQGFPRARVDTSMSVSGEWADIAFRISEGEPVMIDSVTLVGIRELGLGDDLVGKLNSRKGNRYSEALVRTDVDTIEARMRNTGYPLGVVLPRSDSVGANAWDVTLRANPGPRSRIGAIRITHSAVDNSPPIIDTTVIKSILRFSSGDIYSERALYESQRQFYRVGNFLTAQITPVFDSTRTDTLVDVDVVVVEDLMHLFSIEPGYGTLDCLRTRMDYTDKAFLKGLNRLDVSGQISKLGWANPWPGARDVCRKFLQDDDVASDSVNYNATVTLTRPVTLHGGLLPSFSAYRERRGGYKAYLRTTKIGGSVALSKSLTRTIVSQATYNLEYGHTNAAETVLCFLFQACDAQTREQLTGQDKRLAVVGLSASRDLRNFTDSASRGTALHIDLRTASPYIGSDTSLSFRKGFIDGSWYTRLVGAGVLAARFRAGVVGGGVATSGVRLPPPQERLYTGGETSIRGYGQNELGPLIYATEDPNIVTALAAVTTDTARLRILQDARKRVIPAGGNAMYVGNLEYRLPGPLLPTLQTILFVDAGKLWTRGLDDAGQGTKWTPGIAFKYFSPVGPIQVNFGYNRYQRPDGPVYLDQGVGSQLVCLSGSTLSGQCAPIAALRPPNKWYKRITLTVAFPPDF